MRSLVHLAPTLLPMQRRPAAATGPATRRRGALRRVVASLVALASGVFAMFVVGGAPALVASWSAGGGEVVHRVHGVGFGAIMTLAVGLPLLAQAHRPQRKVSLLQAAIACSALLLVAGFAAGVGGAVAPFAIFLVAGLAIAVAQAVPAAVARAGPEGPDRRLLGLAAAGAVPLVVYAAAQIAAQRAALVGDPHAAPEPHYTGMAALALCIVAMAFIAAQRSPGYRLTAALAGLSAVSLGLVSLLNAGFVSALHPLAAFAAVAWGISFVVAAPSEQTRSATWPRPVT